MTEPHRVDFHRPSRPMEGCTINVHPDPTPTDELAEAERKRLLEYIDAAMGIICNAHSAQIVAGEDPPDASPGWAEAARRWIDAYPPKAT